ncbi:uncharacterized protein LOC112556836 isoform X3 [Pomacea canaliculata]|uniref:uncharacterized protein LOC112556836 isoform X3 n=1 Tax=Pomacea canaliculata TaxID=400727 RepID=UPI000D738912|nr:uncharacterized protein LOC112556836 isoform X3 [Pomacea canaliculata]
MRVLEPGLHLSHSHSTHVSFSVTLAGLLAEYVRAYCRTLHGKRDWREGVMKELERERMLRVDTEQRLHEMRVESDSCRARLQALQDEFRKMEEMVQEMLQYKTKIDQLKQEKTNLTVTYENNLQKCRNHISRLERENMMLLNQVKKMESQLHGKGDERDKSRLLLERLKMVEAENSSLVLENEQQRQQYEKCLDQIANQVVQALLAQKTLREECMKLQQRVQDLELQNQQLNHMFQQRVRFPSDSALQHLSCSNSTYVCQTAAGSGEVTSAQFLQGSAASLQSMCSETMFDDSPGQPQMSTPPPWLRDRLELLPLDDDVSLSSSSSGSPSSPTTPATFQDRPTISMSAILVPGMTTKIETEFPATNSSPKVKRINVFERGTRSLERRRGGFAPLSYAAGPGRGNSGSVRLQRKTRLHQVSSDAQTGIPHLQNGVQLVTGGKQAKPKADVPESATVSPRLFCQGVEGLTKLATPGASSSADHAVGGQPNVAADSTSKLLNFSSLIIDKVKLRRKNSAASGDDAVHAAYCTPMRNSLPPSVPFHSQYYYDYSDEDSDSRPVSRICSSASTVSLSELLDTSGEAELPLDEDFFSDWSSVYLSPQHKLSNRPSNIHSLSVQEPSPCSQENGLQKTLEAQGEITVSESSSEKKKCTESKAAPIADCEPSSYRKPEAPRSACKTSLGTSEGPRVKDCRDLNTIAAARVDIVNCMAGNSKSSSNAFDSGQGISEAMSSTHDTLVKQTESPSEKGAASKNVKAEKAEVNTVSVFKSVTEVQLPTKQTGVLLNGSTLNLKAGLRDCSPSNTSQHFVENASPQVTEARDGCVKARDKNVESNCSIRNDIPFCRDLVTSVISCDALGTTTKLKSQPLTGEEKSRVCRPDHLILAPADKHFNFHGFTSSSSCSSEENSSLIFLPTKHIRGTSPPGVCGAKESSEASPLYNPDSAKANKIPPPVPQKPSRISPDAATKSVPQVVLPKGSLAAGDPGGSVCGSETVGKFPASTTLTVGFMTCPQMQIQHLSSDDHDSVQDFVNLLVKDMKERVARHTEWSTISSSTSSTTTTVSSAGTLAYCKSLDSSFESLRAERSGSKDDGYSTMSSDIHPNAMDRYAFPDSSGGKPSVEGTSSGKKVSEREQSHMQEGASISMRDKSFETSDQDSAMETSTHSMDTRTSSQSLSSQVSSSSGDNALSPVSKVTRMARFFEEEAGKTCRSNQQRPGSCALSSPLSPTLSSVGTPDSSLCLSPSSSQSPCSVVQPSIPCTMAMRSSLHSFVPQSGESGLSYAGVHSPLSVPFHSPASSGKVHLQRTQDELKCEPGPLQSGLPHPHTASSSDSSTPSDVLVACPLNDKQLQSSPDILQYQLHSVCDSVRLLPSPNLSLPMNSTSRRENVMSWPPCKQNTSLAGLSSNRSHTDNPSASAHWEPALLHVSEEKFLDDIPEESSDEWENLYVRTFQEQQQQQQQQQQQAHKSLHQHFSGTQQQPSSSKMLAGSTTFLTKAKSESNLWEKPQLGSLYDEMMSGSWDSSKVLERSASVSEVDCRSRILCAQERASLQHSADKIFLDETEINQRVAVLLGRTQLGSAEDDLDSETETAQQIMDLKKTLMSKCLPSLPKWKPQETVEKLKKNSTPSPSSIQKMDGISAEDWLLKFTKEEIEKHTSGSLRLDVNMVGEGLGKYFGNRGENERSQTSGESDFCYNSQDSEPIVEGQGPVSAEDADSSECSARSPVEEQKQFNSQFYSLCLVESSRSLSSSVASFDHDHDREHEGDDQFQPPISHPSFLINEIKSKEFDDIARQIASLSRTVDELSRSLNSLNSAGSGGSNQDLRASSLNHNGSEAVSDAGATKQECIDGYHWVDDEFYLTSCGGEVIIGSATFLEEGLHGYCEDGAGEEGGLFHSNDDDDEDDNSDHVGHMDASDDFFTIRMPLNTVLSNNCQFQSKKGLTERELLLNRLTQFRYNSDGQLDQQDTGVDEACMGWRMENSVSHASLSGQERDYAGNSLIDKETRTNLLGSVLASGGESNDSLSSDIGLDHMMCQRLIGRKGKLDVVRIALQKPRPVLDFSKFFIHFGKPEQEAVAAFDFLEDISTSESGSENPSDPMSRRSCNANHVLSKETLLRQAAAAGHLSSACNAPRLFSGSDFTKFCVPKDNAGNMVPQHHPHNDTYQCQPQVHLGHHHHQQQQVERRRTLDTPKDGGATTSSTPPLRRRKMRQRRRRAELRLASNRGGDGLSPKSGAVKTRTGTKAIRSRRGERMHGEWPDLKQAEPAMSTLSLSSDSCCDGSSSSSSPSVTDLTKF